jgi:drug/metabolite transporter (DMT)-like permease
MSAIYALLASLVWGVSDFLGGTASRRLHALAVVGASQAIALAVLIPWALVAGGFGKPLGYLPWAMAAGVLGLAALFAFYAALAQGTMGVVAPIAATGVVVPVAVGLIGGDSPSAAQLFGIVIAAVGVILAGGPELRGMNRVSSRPIVLATAAALMFGVVAVLMAKGSRHDVLMTVVGMRLTSFAIVAAIALIARTRGGVGRAHLPLLGVIGLADAGGTALYGFAATTGLLSIVSVLAALYPAITVLLARYFHNERMKRIQEFGVVAVFCGIVLIAAGG